VVAHDETGANRDGETSAVHWHQLGLNFRRIGFSKHYHDELESRSVDPPAYLTASTPDETFRKIVQAYIQGKSTHCGPLPEGFIRVVTNEQSMVS